RAGLVVAPAAVRALLPFSDAVQGRWFELRQLAKRYDSYQWQKLFWFGLGMVVYLAVPGRRLLSQAIPVLAVVCIGAGAAGLATWRVRLAQLKERATAPQAIPPVGSHGGEGR